MLKNYLKIAVRNLVKSKLFSIINIGGMAISISIFLVIALFIVDEYKFDQHVEDVSMKYRLYNDLSSDDGSTRKASMVSPMIAPTLAAEFPEVDYYSRFLNNNNKALFEVGDKKLTESGGGYADPTIFKMFSLHLSEGDPNSALTEPNTIGISKTLATKYFGSQPALDKSIKIGNNHYTVKAVFEDFSEYSHVHLNYFLSLKTYENLAPDRMTRWGWSQFHTYIKLKPDADPQLFESKLAAFAQRHPMSEERTGYLPHIMPMTRIHLDAYDHHWDIADRGNMQTVYILSATAIFILVIAILNFINLSTARAINRVKEVGVRKVMGAFRIQLIYQFISESVIIALIALIIAGSITELVLPMVNSFTGKNIPLNFISDISVVLSLIAFAVLIGMAAGAYPAFYISKNRPVSILSSKRDGKGSEKSLLRQTMVVLQFVLSFFLIIASLIVSDQHTFMRTANMGFDKDNLVVVSLRGDMRKDLLTTKNAFLNNPNVVSASMGYGLPGEAYAGDGFTDKVTNKKWHSSMLAVDEDYVKTLGLQIVAGRDFSKDSPSDIRNAFILSEAAARMIGYDDPSKAVGHDIAWDRWDKPDSLKEGKIIGVIKDMHLNSMRDNVTPVMLQIFPFAYSTMTLKISSENIPATIAHLESSWKKFNSDWPFEYRFLDDNFDKLYKAEEKLARLFAFFTGFTIFVACLGLFGLVVYSTSQRYKEISIRKVLGANESSLVILLGRTYLFLIIIAFVVAIPFSYYAANQWLQKFAYRIDITPLLFVKAAVFILAISLLTVGIQSLKAARNNPVDALKEQ